MCILYYWMRYIVDNLQGQSMQTLDGATTTVLQIMVLGITITEWMSKLREVRVIAFLDGRSFVKYTARDIR